VEATSLKDINFLVAGVGGQGTVLTGDILAEVGMSGGYDAKKSDVLGLAIRSGSVISHVRWGRKVHSPMSEPGRVDYLLAFEPLEALRLVEYLAPGSTVILNEYRIPPGEVSTGQARYPEQERIAAELGRAASRVHHLDATARAQEVGNVKVLNVLLLGALSALLPVEAGLWEAAVAGHVPERLRELNLKAFRAGRSLLQ
jgi:indolepyruvate ferredoxin oxidoreductase beta subunit